MLFPKQSHELALKHIEKYLKNTYSCGMVINLTRELTVDAYPDADFSQMYGNDKPTDPACAKSCSGFMIVFAGVLVLWQSKLQTETALSTMEAKVNTLAAEVMQVVGLGLMGSVLLGTVQQQQQKLWSEYYQWCLENVLQ